VKANYGRFSELARIKNDFAPEVSGLFQITKRTEMKIEIAVLA